MQLIDSFLLDGLLIEEVSPFREIFLAIATSGIGDGTRLNPFNASTAVLFDKIMENHGVENVVVRLGPGLFRTQGGDVGVAQNPLLAYAGMRIQGSGIFNTTLRLTAKPR